MGLQRRLRFGAIAASLLAVAGAALTATGDSLDLVVLFIFLGCAVLAASFYWVVSRYPSVVELPLDVDPGSDQMLTGELFGLLGFCVPTLGLVYVWSSTGWVSDAALTVVPPEISTALAAALPGIFLGFAVPALAEREVLFHWFGQSYRKRFVGKSLRIVVFLYLLFALPAAVIGFIGTYTGSRVALMTYWRVSG
jgi:hypothetical protein